MKRLNVVLAFLVSGVIGCGAGHANLTSITVTTQSATNTSSPEGQVGYTAIGISPTARVVYLRQFSVSRGSLANEHRHDCSYYRVRSVSKTKEL
jgi:hypothetical protein